MLRHCTQCGDAQPGDARFCPKCGAAVIDGDPKADPLLGKVVAERYLLLEKIGQGGAGTIYRAEHTTLRKKVAVKILHHQLSRDETAVERFRREATTVGEIDNDHILQVLDFGRSADHRLFFAMEFLDGETLAKVMERERQLPVKRVIDVATQVTEALMEAHGLGYIHRDLRPSNIFLTTRRGRSDFVKLLDFGLAKLILPEVEAQQTALGMTFGDPRYMSPEQARGETVDRRADLYSLGVMMYEMLTGAAPFAGSGTFDVLQKVLESPVPRVRDLRPDCPEWLDRVVQQALAKRPEDRFVTGLKLLECLRSERAVAPAPAAPEAKSNAAATKSAVAQKSDASATQMMGGQGARSTAILPRAKGASAAPPPPPPENDTAPNQLTPTTTTDPGRGRLASDASGAQTVVDAPKFLESAPVDETKEAVAITSSKADERPPTGEWFDEKFERAPGAPPEEDEYEDLPPRNRAPLIIGGVAGGLLAVLGVVIFLLPKPAHKPLRGEAPDTTANTTATATAPAAPVGAPTPAPAAPAPTPAPAPAAPAPTAPVPTEVAAAAKPAESPKAAEAPKPIAEAPKPIAEAPKPIAEAPKPIAEAPKPVAAAPKPEPKPVAAAPKPEPKPVAAAPKPEPKPVAAAPKPEPKPVAAAPKPEPKPEPTRPPPKQPPPPTRVASTSPSPPSTTRNRRNPPEGFKDPFSESQPTAKPAAAEAAQAEFFVKLGRQKLSASDLSAAASNFNKAREFDPRSPEAFAGLGEVAFEQADYGAATVHLKQALRLSPNRARYLVLLGQAYYKLGRPKDAVGEYRKALRVDPANQEAQHSLEVAERKLAAGG